MTTKNLPVHMPAEQQRWNEGLTKLIGEMRNTNSAPDVAMIASKIAEFRKQFIGDPTKILNLD